MARQITLSKYLNWQPELACYFKSESTDIVAFCFGISENTVFKNSNETVLFCFGITLRVFQPIDTVVLFICKTKSRLRRRHCGLVRHFKTDPTESEALCFGYAKTLFWRRRHCGLARHFKTDPTKTVALCFGYEKTLFWRADGKADEQAMCQLARWRGYLYTIALKKRFKSSAYSAWLYPRKKAIKWHYF
jgi:hypothetical protein